jgi:lysophospholipase L1-like esterase
MSAPIKNVNGPLVLLGASYAKGWQRDQLGGVTLVNKGVAGEQSFELLSRFDADVLKAGPRAVVIWGFINDVFRTPRAELSDGLARARESIATMVDRARAAGVEPILATEVTLAKPPGVREALATWVGWLRGKQGYQDYINSHVRDTNAWLREFARAEGLVVLDLEAALSDGSGMRVGRFATADGSHISAEGYAALTAYAEPILREHFASR